MGFLFLCYIPLNVSVQNEGRGKECLGFSLASFQTLSDFLAEVDSSDDFAAKIGGGHYIPSKVLRPGRKISR